MSRPPLKPALLMNSLRHLVVPFSTHDLNTYVVRVRVSSPDARHCGISHY